MKKCLEYAHSIPVRMEANREAAEQCVARARDAVSRGACAGLHRTVAARVPQGHRLLECLRRALPFVFRVTRLNAQATCSGLCSYWSVRWACTRTQRMTQSYGRLGALVGLSACNDMIIRWESMHVEHHPWLVSSVSWLYPVALSWLSTMLDLVEPDTAALSCGSIPYLTPPHAGPHEVRTRARPPQQCAGQCCGFEVFACGT